MMAEQKEQYPILGFYFKVSFQAPEPPSNNTVLSGDKPPVYPTGTINFQSVSGLTKEITTESYREGGQMYDYALPVKVQYSDLILKRGLLPLTPGGKSVLENWLGVDSFNDRLKRDITIELLSPSGALYMTWNVKGAWPKKWAISDFNAEENQVVIETLELHYDCFDITDSKNSIVNRQNAE